MEKLEYRRNADAMIWLVSCAIHKQKPDPEKLKQIDLDALFEVCQNHILTACVAYALESADIHNPSFTKAKAKAIAKNLMLDTERAKILHRLEQEHIWYMPLKGSFLQHWYPKPGMRQMADNDILCDSTKMKEVQQIFLDEGFSCLHFGKRNHDVYFKEPVLLFEMHHSLFYELSAANLYTYYENVKSRLIPDDGSEYGYHFSNEDFYLYFLSHEYNHYSEGGTGVRYLVDTYVLLQKYGDSLNWEYIHAESQKLDIAEFEQQNRELAMAIFGNEKLSDAQKQLLDYYIFSGTYGTFHNSLENQIQNTENGSESKYLFHRLFPPMEKVKAIWPFFYRHKWLMPVLWIYRPFHGLFVNRKKILAEMKYLKKREKKRIFIF